MSIDNRCMIRTLHTVRYSINRNVAIKLNCRIWMGNTFQFICVTHHHHHHRHTILLGVQRDPYKRKAQTNKDKLHVRSDYTTRITLNRWVRGCADVLMWWPSYTVLQWWCAVGCPAQPPSPLSIFNKRVQAVNRPLITSCWGANNDNNPLRCICALHRCDP